jgi:hypothetical protein
VVGSLQVRLTEAALAGHVHGVAGRIFCWRAFRYTGPDRNLAVVAGCLVPACVLASAVLVMRTCLIVTADDLIDRRMLRKVRTPWEKVTAFRVARPGWQGGGPDVDTGLLAGSILTSS